jgi:hypothetical protein
MPYTCIDIEMARKVWIYQIGQIETHNDLHNTTQKIKDWTTQTPLKAWGELRCPGWERHIHILVLTSPLGNQGNWFFCVFFKEIQIVFLIYNIFSFPWIFWNKYYWSQCHISENIIFSIGHFASHYYMKWTILFKTIHDRLLTVGSNVPMVLGEIFVSHIFSLINYYALWQS